MTKESACGAAIRRRCPLVRCDTVTDRPGATNSFPRCIRQSMSLRPLWIHTRFTIDTVAEFVTWNGPRRHETRASILGSLCLADVIKGTNVSILPMNTNQYYKSKSPFVDRIHEYEKSIKTLNKDTDTLSHRGTNHEGVYTCRLQVYQRKEKHEAYYGSASSHDNSGCSPISIRILWRRPP